MKHVKRTVAATSESSQLPLSGSSPDVVRPSQTTSGGEPRRVGVEPQPVNRLSEKIRGWMGGMKVIKNEEEK